MHILNIHFSVVIQLLTIIFLALPAFSASSSPSVSDNSSYEIPLSDLKAVDKNKAKKAEKNLHKKKKKSSHTNHKTSDTPSKDSVTHGNSSYSAMDLNVLPKEALQQLAPNQIQRENSNNPSVNSTSTDEIRIIHDPYSYVVSGKRTIIKTIISSRYALKSIYCQFRGTGGSGLVPMTKIEGSQYTYSAILPALEQNTPALKYLFLAVDTQGNKTSSQEFVTAANSNAAVPGWQQEPSQTPLEIRLENPKKPLAGFADITTEE